MSSVVLPEGWVFSTLEQSISKSGLISDGDWIETKDQDTTGSVRLIQLADIGDGDFRDKSARFMTPEKAKLLNCTYLQSGDVLVARMPDPLGRACIFPEINQNAVTVVDICLVRTGKKSAITNQLLKYWINSPEMRGEIEANASGTTRQRITRKKLEVINFPLPPLAEQKVIAEKLDELLAQVDILKTRLTTIPTLLKRFRQSVLAAAVSGKLTEEWNALYSCSPWKTAILEDIVLFQNGFAFESGWFQKSGDFQIIKLANVKEGYLKLEAAPAFLPALIAKEHIRFRPKIGDILISMTGTRYKKDYGYVCKINEDIDLLVNQRVGRIMPLTEKVLPDYLLLSLRSDSFKTQFFKGETGGVNQGNVGSKHILGCSIFLPSLEEQTEIVRRVEQLFAFADQIEQQVKNAQSRVNNLTQSILAKAFRGELTADWRAANPDLITGENSAQALLAKIKAERDKPKKTPKQQAMFSE